MPSHLVSARECEWELEPGRESFLCAMDRYAPLRSSLLPPALYFPFAVSVDLWWGRPMDCSGGMGVNALEKLQTAAA